MPTKIEWCNETWNPITGCTAISEGCKNCYARRMAQRLKGRFGYPEDDPFQLVLHSIDVLNKPLKWKNPRKIFVCSMGDLFHEDLPDWMITQVMDRVLYDGISHHTWMLLTKRPKNMHRYFESIDNMQSIFENVWLGITAENQKRYDERWTILGNDIPAAVKFVSLEPALEHIDIDIFAPWPDWVIWGPETGPGKRLYENEWAESVYEQCREKNIPFFDKRKKNWIAREFPNTKSQ